MTLPPRTDAHVRVRILQAFALVGLLHTLTPIVDPAQVHLSEIDQHYGETIQIQGRVTDVEATGEVVRLTLAGEGSSVAVLTRGPRAPLGATVTVRGQPSPGDAGAVIWAEGRIETKRPAAVGDHVTVGRALSQAPRFADRPIAVAGTWIEDEAALVGPGGRLPVQAAGIDPEPGRALLWGRLVYEPERAGYELEATGWRPWTPSAP